MDSKRKGMVKVIWVTGDTHGQKDLAKLKKFADENSKLTKSDYVIVAGDFGGVWDERTLDGGLKHYQELPFSILFVDGNHENFDLLNAYPVEIWNGGKVHKIKPEIIHLMRGQVFTIEGKRILALGGADSKDKEKRLEYEQGAGRKVWWAQEQICRRDIIEAIENLRKHGNKVDYAITHCASADVCEEMLSITGDERFRPHVSEKFLREIFTNKEFKFNQKFCGHYHYDSAYQDTTFVFRRVIRIA